MFTHKMFNLVLRSLAVVFIIAISVPFSSSSAPAKGKGIFCDDGSTFEMGEATAFPFDTVEVPVKFRTDSTLGGFANNILWNAEKASYVEVIPGTGLPQGWELTRVELLEAGNLMVGGNGDATTFTDDPVYWIKLVPSGYGYGDSVSMTFPPDPQCTGPNYYSYQDDQYVPKLVDGKIVVGVTSDQEHLERPIQYSLLQNYPNPFNQKTEIRYALPRDCEVRLDVYSILGQRVATLVNGKQTAGYKSVRWDASGLPSGIYFYRLKAGDFVQTRKMVVLK